MLVKKNKYYFANVFLPHQSPQETETLGFETATQFSNGAVKQEAGGS